MFLSIIYHYLPSVRSIGGYARVENLKNKMVEQVKQLAEKGYSYFYFGVESGDDKLLDRMNEGYHSDLVIEHCKKMDESGMLYHHIAVLFHLHAQIFGKFSGCFQSRVWKQI